MNVHLDDAGADSCIIVEEYARTQNLKMTEFRRDPGIPAVEKAPTASVGDAPLVPRQGGPGKTKHLLDLIIDWKGTKTKQLSRLMQSWVSTLSSLYLLHPRPIGK